MRANYAIEVLMDKNIGQFKLKYDTSDLDRYNYVDYSYTSNNSKTAKNIGNHLQNI